MQILIDATAKVLVVEHAGQKSLWPYRVWGKLNEQRTEDIFGPTNEFLLTLPGETQKYIFERYVSAANVIREIMPQGILKDELINHARDIMACVDRTALFTWANIHGRFHVEKTPALRTNKNPPALTYTEEESFGLLALCTASKILAPMIGTYVDGVMEKTVKGRNVNLLKEQQASYVFLATDIVKWPEFARLELYLSTMADRKKNLIPMAIRFGAAAEDLDKYLVGLTVVRRLMVASIRDGRNGSIIAFIYRFLDEKLTELTKPNDYRNKFNREGDEGAEAESYSDQFRIPEEVDAGIVITCDLDLRDMQRLANFLEVGHHYEEAVALFHNLRNDPNFIIMDEIHYRLCGMLIRFFTFHQIIDKIERDTLLGVIAVSSIYCREKGWLDLAQLLVARRVEKDLTEMDMGIRNGVAYRKMNDENATALKELYKHPTRKQASKPTNAGKEAVEDIVSVMLKFNWDGIQDPSDIRNSLARFILERPMQRK